MKHAAKLRYAAWTTGLGGLLFALVADMQRFPGGWFGYGLFLAFVFLLALYLYGKVD
jgi:hypothetical protein